jgi:hypothetical protein
MIMPHFVTLEFYIIENLIEMIIIGIGPGIERIVLVVSLIPRQNQGGCCNLKPQILIIPLVLA